MLAAPKLDAIPVTIRVGLDEDRNFIGDSWTRTLLRMGHNMEAIDFFPRKLADIAAHIERAAVLVAHLEGEPSEIVSYLVYLRRRGVLVVHFAYTKDLGRRQGIVRELLRMANPEELPIAFTQPAKNDNVMRHWTRKAIFDPDLWSQT